MDLSNMENDITVGPETELNFFKMKEEPSEVFEGLSKAQEYTLKQLTSGRSLSQIAKDFGVHFNTLSKITKTVAFVSALGKVNSCVETVTLAECREALSRIIRTSNNESVVVSAVKCLASLTPIISGSELYEAVKDEELSKSRAQEVLDRLGIERPGSIVANRAVERAVQIASKDMIKDGE